ncbi:MAG: hypothetical protein ACFB50_09340 [Rubrobacteraceae bacterium]
MSAGGPGWDEGSGIDWEQFPDVTSVPREELGEVLERLVERERTISYQRRVLQGRIDLIRTELVRRGEARLSREELARILTNKAGGGPLT